MEYARAGDTFVITHLAPAARSLKHLPELTEILRSCSIELLVLKRGIDSSTPTGRLAFHMLGAMMSSSVNSSWRAPTKAWPPPAPRGRAGERRETLTETRIRMARQMYDSQEYTVQQIADTFSTSRATIYRALAIEGDFALIVYRTSAKTGTNLDGSRHGETGAGESPDHSGSQVLPDSTSKEAAPEGDHLCYRWDRGTLEQVCQLVRDAVMPPVFRPVSQRRHIALKGPVPSSAEGHSRDLAASAAVFQIEGCGTAPVTVDRPQRDRGGMRLLR